MKKTLLSVLSVLIIVLSVSTASAKSTSNSSLASAIRLYKSGNYTQSYESFKNIVRRDPSNAVAYYYLAMSAAQVGKKEEAIENYSRVIDLSTNRQLTNYATKGKVCLEDAEKCSEPLEDETDMDRFVRTRYGSGFSEEARSEHERQKIENLKRDINRNNDIAPARFREYKDFSSQAPTNDEIVSALRVLQQAGLSNFAGGYNDLYAINNSDAQLLNMFTTGDSSKLSPQVIQSLLTNQFTAGF